MEPLHAMIFAIKRDIDLKLPVDDWLTITLSSPVLFQTVKKTDPAGNPYDPFFYSSVPSPNLLTEALSTHRKMCVAWMCLAAAGAKDLLSALVRDGHPPPFQPASRQ